MKSEEYLGLLYNIPLILSLRIIEIVGGLAFAQDPEKLQGLFKPLGFQESAINVRQAKNLRQVLG